MIAGKIAQLINQGEGVSVESRNLFREHPVNSLPK